MTAPVDRRPPAAVLLAAGCGLATALATAVVFVQLVVDLGVDWDEVENPLPLVLPVALVAWLFTGTVLLLTGRSWLVLYVPASGLTPLGFAALAGDVLSRAGWTLGVLLVPGAAAVLPALLGVQEWVALRRAERRARQAAGPTDDDRPDTGAGRG